MARNRVQTGSGHVSFSQADVEYKRLLLLSSTTLVDVRSKLISEETYKIAYDRRCERSCKLIELVSQVGHMKGTENIASFNHPLLK
jgi:hypothetical protein